MPATEPRRDVDEIARLAEEIFDRRVRPTLTPEDDEKFVAIDVVTGEYEIDEDDYTAVNRLHGRIAGAEVWLRRGGYPTAFRI